VAADVVILAGDIHRTTEGLALTACAFMAPHYGQILVCIPANLTMIRCRQND
jgi:hypothetical protein